MSTNIFKMCAMFSLVASLGLVTACGNNDDGEDNNANNPAACATGQTEVTVGGEKVCKTDCSADATVCAATEMCGEIGGEKVCVPKEDVKDCPNDGEIQVSIDGSDVCAVDCSSDANVCQATEECKDVGTDKVCQPKENTMTSVDAPTCASTPKPARCDADSGTFTDWAPASIVSTFAISNPAEETCCFDYNGDATPDNGLGDALSLQGDVFKSLNDGVSEGIAGGSFALLLEHDGVDLAAGGDFSVYFMLGVPQDDPPAPKADGSSTYKVNPLSFEAGTYPQAAALGKLEGSKVTAGPGVIRLNIALFGANLSLRVTAVQIAADVGASTSAATGVFLENGKLGGIIKVADVFGALNEFSAKSCGCIMKNGAALSTPLVEFDENNLSGAACTADLDAAGCDDADQIEGICKTLVNDACGFINLIADVAPDIDANNLGQDCLDPNLGLTCNAISVGATFEAVGAKIVGVDAAAE